MGVSHKIGWKVYGGLFNTLSTIAANKLSIAAWKSLTDEEPPLATDPDASSKKALAWLFFNGMGVATVQLFVCRMAAKRWMAETGRKAPTLKSVDIKV